MKYTDGQLVRYTSLKLVDFCGTEVGGIENGVGVGGKVIGVAVVGGVAVGIGVIVGAGVDVGIGVAVGKGVGKTFAVTVGRPESISLMRSQTISSSSLGRPQATDSRTMLNNRPKAQYLGRSITRHLLIYPFRPFDKATSR